MKKAWVIIVIILCLGGGFFAVLKFTDIIDTDLFSGDEAKEAEGAFYVEFMDDYFLIGEDGTVLGCSSEEPDGILLVENMMFNSLVTGKKADAASESTLEYVQEVCSLLDEHELSAAGISVSDGQITILLTDTMSVYLGDDEDTDIKLRDLKSMYSSLMSFDGGILYMTAADTDGQGYTFKEIASDDDADDAEDDETEQEE